MSGRRFAAGCVYTRGRFGGRCNIVHIQKHVCRDITVAARGMPTQIEPASFAPFRTVWTQEGFTPAGLALLCRKPVTVATSKAPVDANELVDLAWAAGE